MKFGDLLTFYRKFRENLLKNLENFGNMDLQGSENSKKISRKINGNLQNVENFHEFLLEKANFNKN